MPFRHILNHLLGPAERMRWEAALVRGARVVAKGEELVGQGEQPRALRVVLSGWAAKVRQLPDGRRQIVAIFLPGELCDLDLFTVMRTDHAITTLRHSTVAELGLDDACEVIAACPRLPQVLCRSEIVSAAIQREWMTSLGQRSAIERVAHLMCELFVRQRGDRGNNARFNGGSCDFFLTQSQIAEATGLTQVHVNRTIQQLRKAEGVDLRNLRLEIPDFASLARRSGFSPQYLHLGEADLAIPGAEAVFGQNWEGAPDGLLAGALARRHLSTAI